MFPFSSLSTQVPLIMLAAAYMIYFGTYALGKSKENYAENQPEPKEESVIIDHVSESGKTFYYINTSELTQNITVPEERILAYSRSYIPLLYYDPDRRTCSSFISFNLFSRPPPIKA